MARMRVILVLLVAIAAGGGLAYGTYNYVQNVPAQRRAVADAAGGRRRDRPRGWLGPPASRTFASSSGRPSSVPAGVFEKPDDVVGLGLVMPVIQNEPILPMKLASKEAGSGLPIMIPEGERALSVRVNEVIGVAGYVLPGTRVDVVAVASATDNKADTTSKVVLTNVQVLAAGTKMEQDGDQGKPMPVSVVTLLVDPDQAERLTLASTEGKIQLALRNPLDQGAPTTPGVRPASLLGQAPVSTAAHAREGSRRAARSRAARGGAGRTGRPRSKSSAVTSGPKKSFVRRIP